MEAVRNEGSIKIIFSALEVWGFEGFLLYFQDFFVSGFKCRCLVIRNGSRNWSQNTRTPQRKWLFCKCWGAFTILWSLCSQLWPCPALFLSSTHLPHAQSLLRLTLAMCVEPIVSSGFEPRAWASRFITTTALRDTDTFQQEPDHPGSELLKGPIPLFPLFSQSLI